MVNVTMKKDLRVRELIEKIVYEHPYCQDARDLLYFMIGYLGIEESTEDIDAGAFLAEFYRAANIGLIEWR